MIFPERIRHSFWMPSLLALLLLLHVTLTASSSFIEEAPSFLLADAADHAHDRTAATSTTTSSGRRRTAEEQEEQHEQLHPQLHHHHRQLQLEEEEPQFMTLLEVHPASTRSAGWEALNSILWNAVIQLPDASFSNAGVNLNVNQLSCTNLRVQSILLLAQKPNDQQVKLTFQIVGLDMICRAKYNFAGYLGIVTGDGDVTLYSSNNAASTTLVFASNDYNQFAPHDSYIEYCAPVVNIDELEFTNGGFWGFTLETLQGMFRGYFESMAEERLCQELQQASTETMDVLLQQIQQQLQQYPESGVDMNPLLSETQMQQGQVLFEQMANGETEPVRLINWQQPDSYPFGFWMDQAWNETVQYLTQPVLLADNITTDMNANVLMREHVLEQGVLILETDQQVLHEGQDQWMHTRILLNQVRIVGLDTLTYLEPLHLIGNYTLESKCSWESISLELDLVLEVKPSTLPDSYITAINADMGITENVKVQMALSQVNAEVAVLLGLNQDDVEALQVGHFLDKDQILSCFLSSIHHIELSALSVEAVDLQPPVLSGFVSEGLSQVLSGAMQGLFLMYKASLLQSSKAFFQIAIRNVINLSLKEQYQSYGTEACQLWDLAPLPASTTSEGMIDVRDLLLEPQTAAIMGGAGQERYGNLFSAFVMPTIQREIFSDDNANIRFIRPMTMEQSGQEGSLTALAPWINFAEQAEAQEKGGSSSSSWVEFLGWERFELIGFDAKVQNLDTIVSPLEVVQPVDSMVLANMIQTGDQTPTRPLALSTRMNMLGIGKDGEVRDMANEVELSLSIPTSMLSFDAVVSMNETALVHFPLRDLENKFCWLATLSKDADTPGLDMERVITTMSAFSFNVTCVSCSSPGGEALPEIMNVLKEAQSASVFQPYLEGLLAEVVQGAWNNMDFPSMIKDAPRLCPHHPDYDLEAVASDRYGLAAAMATPPQLSQQAVETVSALGFVALYSSLLLVAKNYLLTPLSLREPALANEDEYLNQTLAGLDGVDATLLDWTNLSTTLGPWADTVFDQARQSLQESMTNESIDAKRRLNNIFKTRSTPLGEKKISRFLEANNFVRDHLLAEDGSLTFAFDDIGFGLAGISFSLLQARLYGIDTIIELDPLVVAGPQVLQNNIELEELDIVLDLGIQNGPSINNMTIAFSFSGVAVELPLLLAMDIDKLGEMELQRVLKTNTILQCLLPGAHKAYIPKLNFTVGTAAKPVIGGFVSSELEAAAMSVVQALFDSFGDDLARALPGLFNTVIRRTLNTKLDQYVRQQDQSFCSVNAGGGVVDFRDLLLPEGKAKSLGASGKLPYGDLFQTLHSVLDEELSTENGSSPSINSLLSSWTAAISDVEGGLYIDGHLIDTHANVEIGGLDAVIAFRLGDISVLNIDSLGAPLNMLDPVDSATLNNTLSFGVGPEPVRVAARILFSMIDKHDIQVKNEIEVHADLHTATVVFSILLRVAEDALLAFPLKDVSNFHCWLATVISSTDELRSMSLTSHSFGMGRMDLNVTCISCTSPQFGELVTELYGPKDAEDATDTVKQTFNQVLSGDAIHDFFDHLVNESSAKCPHSENYDPSASITAGEQLQNSPDAFGFTDFTVRDSKSSYFNIASSIFAAILLFLFVVGKLWIRRSNKKWKESLSPEGLLLLRRQKEREREQEEVIDLHSTSLFQSPHIPKKIRLMVPVVILLNIALYMGGHLGVISTVDVDVQLAGEEFAVRKFLEFSFIRSTSTTYKNGGMEMSIMLWIFTGAWPYVKLVASLFLWLAPPKIVSVKHRGKLLLWIDTLTKLSVIDIFTMILVLAVLLIYIGGPDEGLSSDGVLYAMKVIVIPGAALYCIVIGQRMSRVSSRFFLEYHDQVVAGAREAYKRGDIKEVYQSGSSGNENLADDGIVRLRSWFSSFGADPEQADVGDAAENGDDNVIHPKVSQEDQILQSLGESIDVSQRSPEGGGGSSRDEEQPSNTDSIFWVASDDSAAVMSEVPHTPQDQNRTHDSDDTNVADFKTWSVQHKQKVMDQESVLSQEEDATKRPTSCFHWHLLTGQLGVAFGFVTVLALLIVGCIFAPSVAVEVSDLWGLALESETNFADVVDGYGVFSVLSSVLLKSQFVLDSTWDYIALGFLFTVGFVSVGMVFFVKCYHFIRQLLKEGWSTIRPNQAHSAYELPSYLRRHAYKDIEIYVVSVVIGCWQLGSVSIYAIHLYCSILDAVYKILTYIGLAEQSTAQCFQSQMAVVDNLLIFFGALLVLLTTFAIQCSKQYRKNVDEACELLRHNDHDAEHLSSHWNTTPTTTGSGSLLRSPRSFWSSSSRSSRKPLHQVQETVSFSENSVNKEEGNSVRSFKTAQSSSPVFLDTIQQQRVDSNLTQDETFSLGTASVTPDSDASPRNFDWDQTPPSALLGSPITSEDEEEDDRQTAF